MANNKLKKIRAKLYGEEEVGIPSEQKVDKQIKDQELKVGANITNTGGTISLTKANIVNALGYTPPTTNTTYSTVSRSVAGLCPKLPGYSNYTLRGNGSWNCDCCNCDCG